MSILLFSRFVFEKLGISQNVISNAEDFFKVINGDKSKLTFDFTYSANGKSQQIRVIIDTSFPVAGRFDPHQKVPTITIRDRANLEVLTHELKHLDRFLRMGMSAYREDITLMTGIAEFKKMNSILPYKWRTLFFLFYFLQKEEFEAYFHSDWVRFNELVRKEKPTTKEEVMKLWATYKKTIAWGIYSGKLTQGALVAGTNNILKMKIPKQQRPFKFSNWADDNLVDVIVWELLKQKRDLKVENDALAKILKFIVPEHIIASLDKKPPKKYQTVIQDYKAKLEMMIELRMENYYRRYARIPTVVINDLKKINSDDL